MNRPDRDQHPLVLVIDDDVIDRAMVTSALKSNCRVLEAANGSEAKALIDLEAPECIVLDYQIPRTDTHELLIRLAARFPVIVLTGRDEEKVAREIMLAGAREYLWKVDVDPPELQRAVRHAVEDAAALDRSKSHTQQELAEEHRREKSRRENLEADILIARDIQQRLVPRVSPTVPGFEVAGIYLPAAETSGDFFTYVTFPDGSLGIALGDVTGHGIGPALLASELRASVRALSFSHTNLGAMTTIMNRLFWEDTSESRFATFYFARIDPELSTLDFAAAGQASFLISQDHDPRILKGDSFALGLMPETEYRTEGPIRLQTGDVLLLTTDGLIEAVSPTEELFGTQRCIRELQRRSAGSAQQILAHVIEAASRFSGSNWLADDVTIVVVKMVH